MRALFRLSRAGLLILALIAALPVSADAEETPTFGALYQEARQARDQGEHATYASRLAAAVELLPAGDPNRPGTLYELARAHALAGKAETSLATLVRLWEEKAEAPLVAFAETDPAFASVRTLPGYRALLGRMDELAVTVEPVRGKIFRIEGAGCTLAASIGPEGILLVDTGYAPVAGKVREALRKLAPGAPLRFLVNTHAHEDHSAGNAFFASEALILAHAGARRELAGPRDVFDQTLPPRPPAGLPDVTLDRPVTLHLNGEEIRLIPLPSHTAGDLVVIFRGSGVVHMGDTYFPNDGASFLFPGEDPEGFLGNLAVLEPELPEGAIVLSGHAPPAAIDDLRARVRNTRAGLEWVRAQIGAGKSLEEIERLAPAAGLPLPGPWLRYFHEKLKASRS